MNSSTRTQAEVLRSINDLVRPGLDRLQVALDSLAAEDDEIMAPMLQAVFAEPGKRLRPSLTLLVGRLGSADSAALDHMALGVELLHTASLVHDDVVDESATRRGAATLFTRVGNALAVLVGDYLFSRAAQECVATGNLRVVELFARTLGAMAQGQIDEANAQKSSAPWQTMTRERYYRTIWGKTASLFVLACQGSAVLADLKEPQVEGLRTYGEQLGLAFQVVDDILDFTTSEDVLGKPVGSDLRQGTITLPVILLRERDLANGQFSDARASSDVEAQVRLVLESGAIEAAYAEVDRLAEGARRSLEVFPPSPEREALDELVVLGARRRT